MRNKVQIVYALRMLFLYTVNIIEVEPHRISRILECKEIRAKNICSMNHCVRHWQAMSQELTTT